MKPEIRGYDIAYSFERKKWSTNSKDSSMYQNRGSYTTSSRHFIKDIIAEVEKNIAAEDRKIRISAQGSSTPKVYLYKKHQGSASSLKTIAERGIKSLPLLGWVRSLT